MLVAHPIPGTPPPAFLQLAGHPLRWRILSALAGSDRNVFELTELVGEPQNLVSYHLGKLRAEQLVTARRSAADGRDTYYALNLTKIGTLLAAAGGALHPCLRLVRPPRDAAAAGTAKVLFLCTGNSARSQMAEAMARARSGGAIKAYSAGSAPKPLHPNAVRLMRNEYGLDLSRHKSKHLDVFAAERFDWVVSLCDRVREVCPRFPGAPEVIHWSIANPVTGEPDGVTYPLFQQVASELVTRIDALQASIAERKAAKRPSRKKS